MSGPTERTFLGGKVRKLSLPVVHGRPADTAPALKRLLLDQGELAQFYTGDEGMHYLAFVELRAGAVRGNHYHKVKKEWIYVISGELSLVLEDIASGTRDGFTMIGGDLAFIPTYIAHALQVRVRPAADRLHRVVFGEAHDTLTVHSPRSP